MGCDDIRRVISFFLDGSLSDKKKRELDDHFSKCPDCGARTVVQRRLRDFFRRRLQRVTAPERFRVRLTRSLRAVQPD